MSESTFLFVVLIGAVVLTVALWLLYRMIMHPSAVHLPDPDEAVIILDGANEMEVAVMRSKLDVHGIRSFVKNDLSRAGEGAVLPWGWRLLVRYADVDEARLVLGLDNE